MLLREAGFGIETLASWVEAALGMLAFAKVSWMYLYDILGVWEE
jgi:hypothetical protein